jgi:hypothetical protein
MMLNRKVRTLKSAMIDARGKVVAAAKRNRPEKEIRELRTRADAVWQRLDSALRESGFTRVPVSHA